MPFFFFPCFPTLADGTSQGKVDAQEKHNAEITRKRMEIARSINSYD